MRRRGFTMPVPLIAGLLTGLLLAIVAVPLSAQPAHTGVKTPAVRPFYDVTQEVTLSGPVSAVYQRPVAGMIAGSHVMLLTSAGRVDASLGKWGLHGKSAPTIANGEQVTVRGVMKTIRNKEIFFVRTMVVGGHTYTIRNQHGVPVSPQSRERAEKTSQKGESL